MVEEAAREVPEVTTDVEGDDLALVTDLSMIGKNKVTNAQGTKRLRRRRRGEGGVEALMRHDKIAVEEVVKRVPSSRNMEQWLVVYTLL